MTKSNLTNVTILTPNYDSRNGNKIDKITIHHMAGNLSAETCGYVFQNVEASANYGVDSEGRIGCYVEEEYRAWSTANYDNDKRAINIEVANDEIGGNWHVSDKALESLINLCVDICKRYNFKLIYDGTPNGSLTRHNMFMATVCPGPYLQSKFEYIAEEVNKRLEDKPEPEPAPEEPTFQVGDIVVPKELIDYDGTPLVRYDDTYEVIEVVGDRAVLSARGQVWAAMNINNIEKVS